jgi:hypothetical protein
VKIERAEHNIRDIQLSLPKNQAHPQIKNAQRRPEGDYLLATI